MSTEIETYQQRLLLALRLRDVPAERIAEALAEVDSHLAETGEDPVAAFGPPKQYAAEVAQAVGPDGRGRAGWVTREDVTIAAASGLGGWLLADGLFGLGVGAQGSFGLSAVGSLVLGLLLLGAVAVVVLRPSNRRQQRVRDPRTGEDPLPAAPHWVRGAVVLVPLGLLALVYGLGVLLR